MLIKFEQGHSEDHDESASQPRLQQAGWVECPISKASQSSEVGVKGIVMLLCRNWTRPSKSGVNLILNSKIDLIELLLLFIIENMNQTPTLTELTCLLHPGKTLEHICVSENCK